MSQISTHVLDTASGLPAAGVGVSLSTREGEDFVEIGRGETDADGRHRTLLGARALTAGVYRLTFQTGAYFAARGVEGFYPRAVIEFEIREPSRHHHVPLLLAPYGYSTYRGS
ncbi:MAG: hydroxyisourate hydrolase [Polyangiaceae bacterium]|nr:hydroxyisourate hydrolase [Polyangiaceae bacterium]